MLDSVNGRGIWSVGGFFGYDFRYYVVHNMLERAGIRVSPRFGEDILKRRQTSYHPGDVIVRCISFGDHRLILSFRGPTAFLVAHRHRLKNLLLGFRSLPW